MCEGGLKTYFLATLNKIIQKMVVLRFGFEFGLIQSGSNLAGTSLCPATSLWPARHTAETTCSRPHLMNNIACFASLTGRPRIGGHDVPATLALLRIWQNLKRKI